MTRAKCLVFRGEPGRTRTSNPLIKRPSKVIKTECDASVIVFNSRAHMAALTSRVLLSVAMDSH